MEELAAKVEKQPVAAPAVKKADAEWRAELTAEQYAVIRGKGTEESGSGEYDSEAPETRPASPPACRRLRRRRSASKSKG